MCQGIPVIVSKQVINGERAVFWSLGDQSHNAVFRAHSIIPEKESEYNEYEYDAGKGVFRDSNFHNMLSEAEVASIQKRVEDNIVATWNGKNGKYSDLIDFFWYEGHPTDLRVIPVLYGSLSYESSLQRLREYAGEIREIIWDKMQGEKLVPKRAGSDGEAEDVLPHTLLPEHVFYEVLRNGIPGSRDDETVDLWWFWKRMIQVFRTIIYLACKCLHSQSPPDGDIGRESVADEIDTRLEALEEDAADKYHDDNEEDDEDWEDEDEDEEPEPDEEEEEE